MPTDAPSFPQSPGAGALLLHAGITALALAIGLSSCRTQYHDREAVLSAGPADLAPAKADLDAARGALESARRRLALAQGRGGAEPTDEPGPLADLVPAPDDPPAAQERFVGKLLALESRTRSQRMHDYYTMVTQRFLPGFDAATVDRVSAAFATYIQATKAIPWGILGGQKGGAAESWRQVLEEKDRELRAALERELPAEKVEFLMGRFAMKVPAAGEPLPTPRLGGTAPKGK